MNEPIHPTYGTLDQLLAEIGATVRRGELVRIGHHGALSWFAGEFQALPTPTHEGGGDA